MKVFAQNVNVNDSQISAKAWADAYATVASEAQRVDHGFGICYNVSNHAGTYHDRVCGYEMTERLFCCVLGVKTIFPHYLPPQAYGRVGHP